LLSLLEALATKHRSALRRLEGDGRLPAAGRADDSCLHLVMALPGSPPHQ